MFVLLIVCGLIKRSVACFNVMNSLLLFVQYYNILEGSLISIHLECNTAIGSTISKKIKPELLNVSFIALQKTALPAAS